MSELDEKFVADDGVSTVPDAVPGEGGEIKKKKADVKAKADPKADEIEDTVKTPQAKAAGKAPARKADKAMGESEETTEEVEVIEEEVISVEESISQMFEGMDLSEDFKSKVTLVFEAAVNESTKTRVDEAVAQLEENYDKQLQEALDEGLNGIIENLDTYLDYVVQEWMTENEVAIESGIKLEMAESLMDGLKELFTEHNIEIDEDTVDVVAALEEQVAELQTQANESINDNIALGKEINSLKASKVFDEISEGLTVNQQERLKTLSEKLENEDLESYAADLTTLRESFFKKDKAVVSESTDEEEIILDEDTQDKKPASPYSSVQALVEALDRRI